MNSTIFTTLRQSHGFPLGLIQTLLQQKEDDLFLQRIWILDNSGSMAIGDGFRIVETSDGKIQGQAVSRWEELQQTVLLHAELAAALRLSTQFRFLNHPAAAAAAAKATTPAVTTIHPSHPSHPNQLRQEFTVGDDSHRDSSQQEKQEQPFGSYTIGGGDTAAGERETNPSPRRTSSQPLSHALDAVATEELRVARSILQRTKPAGVTPLTSHLRHIEALIRPYQPTLERSGKQIAIIIATDGLPTDETGQESPDIHQEFIHALQQFGTLSIWMVIRLCTNERKVTEFYNQLDTLLEYPLEVLDDHVSEALEVGKPNPWLNYAAPLHRCRELGLQHRVVDLLDERPFTVDEVLEFCIVLFGPHPTTTTVPSSSSSLQSSSWPDPVTQWNDFIAYLKFQQEQEYRTIHWNHWDPRRKMVAPWIDLKVLTQKYGPSSRQARRQQRQQQQQQTQNHNHPSSTTSMTTTSSTSRRRLLGGLFGGGGGSRKQQQQDQDQDQQDQQP